MISDTKKNLNNTIYGRANLPSRLDMATNSTTYIYDANDMRIYKKVDSVDTILKEEYYLRDATGRELAVIDNTYNVNWYIYGKERVASMQHEMPVGLEKLFITGNIPGGKHYAPDRLSTDGTVQSDAILEAGDKVSMLPGFNAPADAEFKADIKKPDGIPNFIYYLYDHLGNTRVTYHVDIKSNTKIDYTVESASDYYPYGKALRSYGKERYQSTYHERDVESGFDYRGARFYDADVARFNSLDPLAAEFPAWSDYNYVLGNPLYYTDPDGRFPGPPLSPIGLGPLLNRIERIHNNRSQGMPWGQAIWQGIKGDAATTANMAPLVGDIKGVAEAFTGEDIITGKELNYLERGLGLFLLTELRVASEVSNVLQTGKWIKTNEHMSEAAASYQKQISGMDASEGFKLDGVKFDGLTKDGTLLDAKSGMKNFVDDSGNFKNFFSKQGQIINQARNQLDAAKGSKIEWHFENKSVMDAYQNLLKKENIQGIDLIHSPRQ